jgi:hypothetical protein
VSASTTSALITGLSNGTTYAFAVTASNAIGSGRAATSNDVTPTAGLPGAPISVTAVSGVESATVSWQPAPTSSGYTITKYVVTTVGSHQSVAVAGSDTSVMITPLRSGTAYTFTVEAYTTVGPGPIAYSNQVTPG